MGALTWNVKLENAAKFHTADIGPKGLVQHNSSDGTSSADRIRRFGTGSWGENLAFGPSKGNDIVMALFIDDGVADRGHRVNIFTPSWTETASNTGTHSGFTTMTTQMFGNNFV